MAAAWIIGVVMAGAGCRSRPLTSDRPDAAAFDSRESELGGSPSAWEPAADGERDAAAPASPSWARDAPDGSVVDTGRRACPSIPEPPPPLFPPPGSLGPLPCIDPASLSEHATLVPARGERAFVRCGVIGGDDRRWRVVLAPRGERLAALTAFGEVRLFDTRTAREIAHLAPPVGDFAAIAFSPDGTRLALLAPEAEVLVFVRAADGSVEEIIPGKKGLVAAAGAAVIFDACGERVVTSPGYGGWVEELRFAAGESMIFARGEDRYENGQGGSFANLVSVRPGGPIIKVCFRCYAVALSPDGTLVAVEERPGGVTVSSAATGEAVASHPGWTGLRGFAPDGSIVLASDEGLTLREPLTGAPGISLPGVANAHLLGTSPEGWMLLADPDKVMAFDMSTGAVVRTAPVSGARDITFGPGGIVAAISGGDGTRFQLWRWKAGGTICPLPGEFKGGLTAAAFSGDSTTLATAFAGGRIETWDPATATLRTTFMSGTPRIASLSVARDGSRLAARGMYWHESAQWALGEVRTADGYLLAVLDEPGTQEEITISPAGTMVATTGEDALVLSEAVGGAERVRIEGLGSDAWFPPAFSPDGAEVAIGRDDGLHIHSSADGRLRRILTVPGTAETTYRQRLLSPDWTVMGWQIGMPGRVKLWRVSDGVEIAELPWGSDAMYEPVLADGAELIASILTTRWRGQDYVEIYHPATASRLRTFPSVSIGMSGGTFVLALAPDGSRVVTGLRYGWDIPSAAILWCR